MKYQQNGGGKYLASADGADSSRRSIENAKIKLTAT
jgi:hypothetical protein